MDIPDQEGSSQRLEHVTNSAVSFSGSAVTYNIAGNQYLSSAAPPKRWTPPLMLPPRAQPFVGREEDLAWLHQQLITSETSRILAICGPGGMGKTALVAEVLNRLIDEKKWSAHFPDGIFYHTFYTYPLSVAFKELARVFEEDSSGDPLLAARRAMSCRRALLVFDGVENLDDTRPLRDLGGKNVVLVISRRRDDALDLVHRRDLGLLPQELSMTLLQELAGPRAADRRSVEQLVSHIGGYPLALRLIGSYLSSHQENVTDYLLWFEREGLTSIDYGKHQDQSVLILLQRTYNGLMPSEQDLFLLLGLLAPVQFRSELVQGILELPQQAFGSLVNLSILRRLGENYEVSHPLVHTFAKKHLSSQVNATTINTWRKRALITLTTHFDQSDPFDASALLPWQPHILPLLPITDLTTQQRLKVAPLLNTVGFHAVIHGRYAEAEPLVVQALEICEQELGGTHPETARSLNTLGELYHGQGRMTEAEPLYLRALAIREQHLGTTHPETARSLDNLGLLYKIQRKLVEAEPLYLRALAIREQHLGTTHPETACSLNSLAELYCIQEKYTEAEPLLIRARTIYEQELGAPHPGLGNCLNTLGVLYRNQRKYTEAERLYRRALDICEQRVGATHFNIAFTLNNLATLYYAQGKHAEAEPLWIRALKICEQQLGITHSNTAYLLSQLAALYYNQKKYAEAEPLYQRALAIYEQQFGTTHPNIASALNNLAAIYHNQEKYAEAEPLYQRAFAINMQELGASHLNTQSVVLNYLKLKWRTVLYLPFLFVIFLVFLITWLFHKSDLVGWFALVCIGNLSGPLIINGFIYLLKRFKRQPNPTS